MSLVGKLVRRYISLPFPKGNAASNVHVTLMLCKLTRFLEKMKLKKIVMIKRSTLSDNMGWIIFGPKRRLC